MNRSSASKPRQPWEGWRHSVLSWMENRQWFLKHPRIHNFWEWVVMPESWGGRLGFRNYCRWVKR